MVMDKFAHTARVTWVYTNIRLNVHKWEENRWPIEF